MENSFKRFLIKKFGLYFLILLLKKNTQQKPTSPKRSNFSLEYKLKKKKKDTLATIRVIVLKIQ